MGPARFAAGGAIVDSHRVDIEPVVASLANPPRMLGLLDVRAGACCAILAVHVGLGLVGRGAIEQVFDVLMGAVDYH